MLILSLVGSALLLAATNAAAYFSGNQKTTFMFAVGGLVGGAFLMGIALILPAFLLSAALVAGAAAICWLAKARPTSFLLSSIGATLIPYGVIGWSSLRDIQEVESRYPVVSIDDRLAYEDNRRPVTILADARPQPSSPVVASLETGVIMAVEHGNPYMRQRALKQLHENTVQTFVDSPGFGVGRMRRGDLKSETALLEIESIPQPSPDSGLVLVPPESRATLPSPPVDERKPVKETDTNALFRQFHTDSLFNFLNAPGFGYVQGRRKVAGFQEHHFRRVPGTKPDDPIDPWRVQRLELVSLLKHTEPCVYLSDNLPRMDELRNAKVRILDDFEARRLPDLLKGEDLVFEQAEKTVRVLGAIRAAQPCLDCHNVQHGGLLGAFSYRLGRN